MSDLLVRAGAQELFLLASPRSSEWICWRNLSFLAARLYGSRCASQQSSNFRIWLGAQKPFLLSRPPSNFARFNDRANVRRVALLPHHLHAPADQLCNFSVRLRAEQFDFFFGPACVKNGRNIRFLTLAMSRVDHSGDALDQLGIGILSQEFIQFPTESFPHGESALMGSHAHTLPLSTSSRTASNFSVV